jgi:hypothetical protein
MKIRTGFVSNSSSSSFVVAFSYENPTVEQILEVFKPRAYMSYSCLITGQEIGNALVRDTQEQKGILICEDNLGELSGMVNDDWEFNECLQDPWYQKLAILIKERFAELKKEEPESSIEQEGWKIKQFVDNFTDNLGNSDLHNWIKKNESQYAFAYSYCDEGGGCGSALEHGDHWNNVPKESLLYESHH